MLGDCPDHPHAQGLSRPPSCSGTVQTTIVHGDCPDHYHARGLSRPLLCSGTVQTTFVHVDCLDHYRARGLPRPPSCMWTVQTTIVLGDCPDHSPNIARRPLSSATCDLYSHTVERHLFRPCYKANTSPSSKLEDYIGTMHLPVHLVSLVQRLDSQLNWEFFLEPGTTCLRHLLPGSGTKWAHFTLR